MKKLWQKNDTWELNSFIESFETKGDLVLDQKLVKYDVFGTMSHAYGLEKIGIISQMELGVIKEGLNTILQLNSKGKFTISDGDEDVHTKIELFLTHTYGAIGKKVHTGRSRNDQVLVALRLYTKDQLLCIWDEILKLASSFLLFANQYKFVPMPGYTHMQQAMPSSWGLWAGAFLEGLLDDLELLKTVYILNNQSPLGSAASYGVPLPLDREYTASLLGFAKVQNNSLYCQNSRGKIEGVILASLVTLAQGINKFASDILLFSTGEFQLLTVDKTICSGSSIMPQKRNVDVAELLRSKVHLLLGNYVQMVSLTSNLISGYNRDLQDTKKSLIESLEMTHDILKASDILLSGITPNIEGIESVLRDEIFATHRALHLVQNGVPFRDAYVEVGDGLGNTEMEMSQASNIEDVLKKSTHLGGTGNLGLDQVQTHIGTEQKELNEQLCLYSYAIHRLMEI